MASFVLDGSSYTKKPEVSDTLGFATEALIMNVRWFIKIRWIIVCLLSAFAAVSALMPGWMRDIGISPPHIWPWVLAVGLMLANSVFWLLSLRLGEASRPRRVEQNMWLQIIVDLSVLTALVHFVGSTETFAAFLYLLHIVCACIFFPPKRSFLVASLSAALYAVCVSLEHYGLWERTSILTSERSAPGSYEWIPPVFAASAIVIWFAVWYLVQTIARAVVRRDIQLHRANQQLLLADEEKNKLVLRTTHDLKAPFSGIESNIQILRLKCGDELSETAREILGRIERRSHSLATRIRDILLLGQIRSENAPDQEPEHFNISDIIRSVVSDIEDRARERSVDIELDLIPLEVKGNASRYSILFLNLISNAVTYAHEAGEARISMKRTDSGYEISVADDGIGIAEDCLPHIFDEYYRTSDAAAYNPRSTGLGLSIVSEIVQKESLKISVNSLQGIGTTFTVSIPTHYCSLRDKDYNLKTDNS